MPNRRKRLEIYLNDHLAAATGGIELAERCRSENRGTPLGSFLSEFVDELEDDRSVLAGIIVALGFERKSYKEALAWTAEKLGRLKPNDELTGYSELSRVLELEALVAGVQAKLGLWRSLATMAHAKPDLAAAEPDELIAKGERQIEKLERFRIDAVRAAFV